MSEKMYHIGFAKEDIEGAKYALVAEDSGRIPLIAKKLDNSKQLVYNRMYLSFLSEISGLFTVCSFLRAWAGAIMHCVCNEDREAARLALQETHDTSAAIEIAANANVKVVERDGTERCYRERTCCLE